MQTFISLSIFIIKREVLALNKDICGRATSDIYTSRLHTVESM